LDPSGMPHGDLALFRDVIFPFDAALREPGMDLTSRPVRRLPGEGPLIEEEYWITEHGIIEVSLTDLDAGYSRTCTVGA
jgi:hypothetical protein